MGKIEVGEYIRTKNKGMLKVCSLRKTPYGYLCGTTDNENISHFTIGKGGHSEIKNNIIKHSKNIIDLIEVGDYVNGYLVIAKSDDGYIEIAVGDDTEQGELLEEKDIKSIVTKEQFANAEYKVKE